MLHLTFAARNVLTASIAFQRRNPWFKLELLSTVERQRLQANREIRAALHPSGSIDLDDHALHVAALRNNNASTRRDWGRRLQIDIVAGLRGARVDAVLHPQQHMRASWNFSGKNRASQR